jgi:hypothetical protein
MRSSFGAALCCRRITAVAWLRRRSIALLQWAREMHVWRGAVLDICFTGGVGWMLSLSPDNFAFVFNLFSWSIFSGSIFISDPTFRGRTLFLIR